jgi:C4-dicarboxylate-specific signal transduction histidine kinase
MWLKRTCGTVGSWGESMDEMDAPSREEILHLTSLAEVFGGFAHEIAQPLNAIMIASQVMQLKVERSGLPDNDKAFMSQRLSIVAAQVQRASTVVETLRKFTRGSGTQQGKSDLEHILKEILGLMDQQFVMRGIDVVLDCRQPLSAIGGDVSTAERVLVQSLAFSRDAVAAIGNWHATEGFPHERKLRIHVMQMNGHQLMHITWTLGHLPEGTKLVDPSVHIGLTTAAAVLSSMGGSLTARDDGLTILFPEQKYSGAH